MRPILVGQQDLDGFLIKEKTSTRMNRRKCLSACLQPERSGAVLKVIQERRRLAQSNV